MGNSTNNQMLDWLDSQQLAMQSLLPIWCDVNSGSYNPSGVDKVGDLIADYVLNNLPTEQTITALKKTEFVEADGELTHREVGKLRRFKKLNAPSNPKLKVLLTGHLDTVFPIDSPFQQCHSIEEGILGGPGVADMKGGILVMINALHAIERSSVADQIDWEIILNPDEEIGSQSSIDIMCEAAKTAQIGLVYEPSMPTGDLAAARKGSGNFSLIIDGKAAHAGREFHLGRNAISALAFAMQELEKINANNTGITLNLGKISGGGPLNIVADRSLCQFNVRVEDEAQARLAQQHIDRVVQATNQLDGIQAKLVGKFTRPAKPASPTQQKLFELVTSCGAELDMQIAFKPTGGCCDGNNLAAAGLPNIDSLGVQGGNIHSHQEYVLLDSLAERAKLSALIMMKLISEKSQWLI
ncbi:MAG: hydrolase [Pseudomonadota bacterium]